LDFFVQNFLFDDHKKIEICDLNFDFYQNFKLSTKNVSPKVRFVTKFLPFSQKKFFGSEFLYVVKIIKILIGFLGEKRNFGKIRSFGKNNFAVYQNF